MAVIERFRIFHHQMLRDQPSNVTTPGVGYPDQTKVDFSINRSVAGESRTFFEPGYETGKAVRWKVGHGGRRSDSGVYGDSRRRSMARPRRFYMLTVKVDEHSLMMGFTDRAQNSAR